MARLPRYLAHNITLERTLERVALSAIAAIVARGEGRDVVISALAIFALVAVVEEVQRYRHYVAQQRKLLDVASKQNRRGRFRTDDSAPGRRKRKRRATNAKRPGV